MMFIQQACRDTGISTWIIVRLKRAAGNRHQWRGSTRLLADQPGGYLVAMVLVS